MEKIKRAYYYFFYKIYKSIEYTSDLAGGKFWIAFKASVVIMVLELWIVFTLINYYDIIIRNSKEKLDLTSPIIFVTLLIIIILNYITFDHYNNIWKRCNQEFDKLSKRENMVGGIIIWTIVLFITINFFVSMHYFHKTFY